MQSGTNSTWLDPEFEMWLGVQLCKSGFSTSTWGSEKDERLECSCDSSYGISGSLCSVLDASVDFSFRHSCDDNEYPDLTPATNDCQ